MRLFLFSITLCTFSFADILDRAVVRIKPSHSNKCLNTMDKSNQDRATIVQWNCSAQAHQLFQLHKNSDGFYFIQSTGSKLCFGVPYAMYGISGVTLHQVGCKPYERKSNEFKIQHEGKGLYSIRPRRAQQTCLGVINESRKVFSGLAQENCELKKSQLFELVVQ